LSGALQSWLPGQLKSEIAPLLAVFVSVDRQLVWIDTRLDLRTV
jgi:hypothetical protein